MSCLLSMYGLRDGFFCFQALVVHRLDMYMAMPVAVVRTSDLSNLLAL